MTLNYLFIATHVLWKRCIRFLTTSVNHPANREKGVGISQNVLDAELIRYFQGQLVTFWRETGTSGKHVIR